MCKLYSFTVLLEKRNSEAHCAQWTAFRVNLRRLFEAHTVSKWYANQLRLGPKGTVDTESGKSVTSAVEPSQPAKCKAVLQTQPNSSFSRLNSALTPSWIGQTRQWEAIDCFSGLFARVLLPKWEWKCDFASSSLALFHNTVNSLWRNAGCEGNLWAHAAVCSQTRCSF